MSTGTHTYKERTDGPPAWTARSFRTSASLIISRPRRVPGLPLPPPDDELIANLRAHRVPLPLPT